MKKTTLAILLFVFFFSHVFSRQPDNICSGDVTLTSQAEVNAFNCTTVLGTLRISGNDIINLSALSALESVGTGLLIQNNPNLTTLDGLSTLTSIGGPGSSVLKIMDNPVLANVNGLSSLLNFNWTTSGHIVISNNAVLEDLTGLLALRAPLHANYNSLFIDLSGNPNLDCGAFVRFFQSLGVAVARELYNMGQIITEENGTCAFESILSHWWGEECTYADITLSTQAEVDAFYCTEIGGTLTISGNDITDLSTLARLQKVGEALIIENNPLLANLDGLSSVKLIDGGTGSRHNANLIIRNNAALENIDGLSSLSFIGVEYASEIIIEDNPSLKNLNGLSSLSRWDFSRSGVLSINNNALLENIDGLTLLRLEGAYYGVFIFIRNNPALIRCSGITPFLKNLEEYELAEIRERNGIVVSENGAGCTLEDILAAEPPESCQGDMILSSQAEVDAFTCTEVKGLLRISGDDITDLGALLILQKVGGGLVIRNNPNLANLDGLSSLDSVKGGITIKNNASLTNIDGLSSLRYFLGDRNNGLIISENHALENLDGLSSLSHFEGPDGGLIDIADNGVLESIHGLASLRSPHVPGAVYDINIIRNPSLFECGALFPFLQTLGDEVINRSNIAVAYNGGGCTLETFLAGFPYNEVCLGNVTLSSQAEVNAFYCPEVEGTLTISGADITDLSALSRLRRIGAGLVIENNPSLTNLDGLSALDSINGERPSRHLAGLVIRNNESLVNINGLSSLSIIHANSFSELVITDNPLLQNLNGLSSFSIFDNGKGGTINISNNAILSNINGLDSLSLAEISLPNFLSIKISDNPLLTPCTKLFPFLGTLGEEALLEIISLGNIRVSDNGEGCSLEDMIANGRPFISNFTLFDVKMDVKVTEDFYDSITVDMGSVDFINWTIQANTYPEEIGSVQFIVDKKIKFTDNRFPYRLNRFIIPLLKPGTHTIRTEVYTKSNGRGKKGLGRTAVITVVNSAAINDFEVVDVSGNVLMKLNDGDVINIQDPDFKSFTIKANTVPFGQVHSVKFWLNKRHYRTENKFPYVLTGDQNGTYNPWRPRVGDYTLRATPYSKTLLKKYAGQSLEIRFKIVKENIGLENELTAGNTSNQQDVGQHTGEEISVMVYPVPVTNELYVKLNNYGNDVRVNIKNIHGQTVYSDLLAVQELNSNGINTSSLAPGVYFLQLTGNKSFSKILKFIKQ